MNNLNKFTNRRQAGEILAADLKVYIEQPNTMVLALPRGGVPVAYEIASLLSVPLDVFVVRKLGVPEHEELALGALASGNIVYFNEKIIQSLHISQDAIKQIIESEKKELKRREMLYRGNKPFPILNNKNIILVDDGIATGATIRAAIKALREQNPARIILAVPVSARSTCEELSYEVDEIICPLKPDNFQAVGLWYLDFSQTTDEEVIELLTKAHS